MRSNPMIRKGFAKTEAYDGPAMTISGTRNKTFIMLGITAIAYIVSWFAILTSGSVGTAYTMSTVAGIAALVLAIITCVKPARAKTFGLLYATCEGLLLGSISLVFELMYPGIVTRTLLLTLLAVVFTLLLYKQAPELGTKIRKGVMIATLSVVAVSVLGLVFSLFGIQFILWSASPIGIVFSLVVVGIAIANLIVDYDNVARGAQYGLPEYMEWYFAFGILVTVVWLYIEILNLLSRMASRNN